MKPLTEQKPNNSKRTATQYDPIRSGKVTGTDKKVLCEDQAASLNFITGNSYKSTSISSNAQLAERVIRQQSESFSLLLSRRKVSDLPYFEDAGRSSKENAIA